MEHRFTADYVRHGKPEYTKEDIASGHIEGTLTPEGRIQVEETINGIADGFSPEEVAIILTSPKQRAKESAELAAEILIKRGINVVLPVKMKDSLKDVQMSPEYVGKIVDGGGAADWMEAWAAEKHVPEGTEDAAHVKKRAQRVINYLRRYAEKISGAGERPHFILFGHEEGVRDILEAAFGTGTKKGEGPIYGESVSIDFLDDQNGKLKMHVKYGDITGRLEFDPASRSFDE